MTLAEEEEEVRSLLKRHQERIMYDLANTDLFTVLVKHAVLTSSEENLLLKHCCPSADLLSNGLLMDNISLVIPASNTSTSDSTNLKANNTISDAVPLKVLTHVNSSAESEKNGHINGNLDVDGGVQKVERDKDFLEDNNCYFRATTTATSSIQSHQSQCTKNALKSLFNDSKALQRQCSTLVEIISKNGFEKFKQFCYAIENECPQLIEDLINDGLKGNSK